MAGAGKEAAARLLAFGRFALRQVLQQGVDQPAAAEAPAARIGPAMRRGGRGFLFAGQGGGRDRGFHALGRRGTGGPVRQGRRVLRRRFRRGAVLDRRQSLRAIMTPQPLAAEVAGGGRAEGEVVEGGVRGAAAASSANRRKPAATLPCQLSGSGSPSRRPAAGPPRA